MLRSVLVVFTCLGFWGGLHHWRTVFSIFERNSNSKMSTTNNQLGYGAHTADRTTSLARCHDLQLLLLSHEIDHVTRQHLFSTDVTAVGFSSYVGQGIGVIRLDDTQLLYLRLHVSSI